MVLTKRTPQDVIVYLFSNIEAGKRFTSRQSEIHKTLYDLSLNRNFGYLLKKDYFDGRISPYSHLVMTVLDELLKTNLLVPANNRAQFEVSPALSNRKKDLEFLFEKREVELIQQMSKEFKSKLIAPALSFPAPAEHTSLPPTPTP